MSAARGTPADAQADYLAGRLAARQAVAALLDVAAADIDLLSRVAEPPLPMLRELRAEGWVRQPVHVSLSLSHRDGRAVAVASPSSLQVGVDLERASAVDPDHARYFLSCRERAARVRTSLAERWALKEAAWKALRCPADTPLMALELVVDDAGALRGVTLEGERLSARAWLPRTWPGYVAAVVAIRSVS